MDRSRLSRISSRRLRAVAVSTDSSLLSAWPDYTGDALPGRYGIQSEAPPELAGAPSGGWAPDGLGWGPGVSDDPEVLPGSGRGSLSSGPLLRTLFTAVETG